MKEARARPAFPALSNILPARPEPTWVVQL